MISKNAFVCFSHFLHPSLFHSTVLPLTLLINSGHTSGSFNNTSSSLCLNLTNPLSMLSTNEYPTLRCRSTSTTLLQLYPNSSKSCPNRMSRFNIDSADSSLSCTKRLIFSKVTTLPLMLAFLYSSSNHCTCGRPGELYAIPEAKCITCRKELNAVYLPSFTYFPIFIHAFFSVILFIFLNISL